MMQGWTSRDLSISIHAAREGGDYNRRRFICGHLAFQSTPPVKAATHSNAGSNTGTDISIHAAREGGDLCGLKHSSLHPRFQSTPPVKAATIECGKVTFVQGFQSTPPVKAATFHTTLSNGRRVSFQSTPPVKAATWTGCLHF